MIGATAAVSGGVLILLAGYVWRVYRRPGRRGDASRMIDAEARVLDWEGETGHVFAEGERWSARGAHDLRSGDVVRVLKVDGLTLVVEPAAEPAVGDAPRSQGG